ncbi:MAG TPA: sodium:solute symporter family protein [Solimonas sp.]|nr:sodium:solute symporter family protein [Solimonas sp.]
MNLILFCILAYIILQLLIAFRVSRKPKSEEDYLLAGRSLGPWMATFSVFATWFGAEACIGASAESYRDGLAGATADPFGYAAGIIAMGLLFAATLWKRGLVTFADLFRQRFGAGVERLATLVMIPSSVLWAAAQIRAFGQVLASSSELGIFAAITLAASVVIIYVSMGGMWTDSVTDLVQGVVLILGVFVLGGVFLAHGGWAQLQAQPAARLDLVGESSPLAWLETFMLPLLSTMVAQELIARVLATRSPRLARSATIAAGVLYLLVGLVPVLLGLGAAGIIGADVEPEQVLSRFAREALPLPLYILFIGALVSAILATLSGALLVAGSLAAHNLLLRHRPGLSERFKLRANRAAVVLFGVIAWWLALSSDSVYELVQASSGLGSAGILVITLFALWGPRWGGPPCAYAALLSSLTVYIAGEYQLIDLPYPYLSSLAAAVLAYALLLPFSRPAVAAQAQATT